MTMKIHGLDPSHLPIGAIARSLEDDVKESTLGTFPSTPSFEFRKNSIYDQYDLSCSSRLDYRLWRSALTPYFAITHRRYEGPQLKNDKEGWQELLAHCVSLDAPPVTLWSTVAILPLILRSTYRSRERVLDDRVRAALCYLYGQLKFGLLRPMEACPASCAIAGVHFLAAWSRIFFEAGRRLKDDEVDDFQRLLLRFIKTADPAWLSGQKINTDVLEHERAGAYRLSPTHSAYDFSMLVDTLLALPRTFVNSINIIDSRSQRLFELAYDFSFTAWRTARSRRIDQEDYRRRISFGSAADARTSPDLCQRAEFFANFQAIKTAQLAGRYVEAAKNTYLMYRLVPQGTKNEEGFWRLPPARFFKEVGLEVDRRFEIDDSDAEQQARIAARGSELRDQWYRRPVGFLLLPDLPLRPDPDELPYDWLLELSVRSDQASDEDWRTVIRHRGPLPDETPTEYLHSLVASVADYQLSANSQLVPAVFRLALKYGLVRSASKILSEGLDRGEMVVTNEDVIDLLHNVRRCTQLDPFGLRQARHEMWQRTIRAACSKLSAQRSKNWISAKERVWLHETLQGRTHVLHRAMRPDFRIPLYSKSVNILKLCDDDLRHFYDREYDFFRRAPSVADIGTLSSFCAKYQGNTLKSPVLVSILQLGVRISLVAIGKSGQPVAEELEMPQLDSDVASMEADSQFWFQLEGPPETQISWRPSFRSIATTIISLAKAADPASTVITLAVDWKLARFPWQNLLLSVGFSEYLIALVPSLTTVTLLRQSIYEDSDDDMILSKAGISGDSAIQTINHIVEATTAGIDLRRAKIRIATGHGTAPEDGELPVLRLGNGRELRTVDDWIRIGVARIIILHCCHSAHTKPVFMQELGGVAGLAMSLGAESLIAPTSEVRSSGAAALQRRLFAGSGAEIGLKYLQALRDDPECSLYNLWGNPYERVLPELTMIAPTAVHDTDGAERTESFPTALAAE
ncbi:MAG TPA: hypothetical protein VMF32_04270 [Xanthobacteraceae bacterium]|nr:hypothetical protein [Xanthobacteraceae bacterium]